MPKKKKKRKLLRQVFLSRWKLAGVLLHCGIDWVVVYTSATSLKIMGTMMMFCPCWGHFSGFLTNVLLSLWQKEKKSQAARLMASSWLAFSIHPSRPEEADYIAASTLLDYCVVPKWLCAHIKCHKSKQPKNNPKTTPTPNFPHT